MNPDRKKPFSIKISQGADGHFYAYCPEVNVFGGGKTEKQALKSIGVCIRSHLDVWSKMIKESGVEIVSEIEETEQHGHYVTYLMN